ncbi:MAG: LD-carboxypeptidase [Owenweeksia sp.]|nr:LD-carboxypeptidase [Owenweeksia sp.]
MDMQAFLDNPDIKAIICVRGGYGTVRIIDHLNFENFAASPKWVCGYSDVTVLHNKLAQLGYQLLHSSMPINFTTNTPSALDSIKCALYGNKISYQEASHPFNWV